MVVFKTVPNVDLLWHASEIFHKADRQRPRPNWNGLMDHLNSEKTKKSIITMLPMTEYNPRDESCIYSVPFCIIQRAKRLSIEIPSTNLFVN